MIGHIRFRNFLIAFESKVFSLFSNPCGAINTNHLKYSLLPTAKHKIDINRNGCRLWNSEPLKNSEEFWKNLYLTYSYEIWWAVIKACFPVQKTFEFGGMPITDTHALLKTLEGDRKSLLQSLSKKRLRKYKKIASNNFFKEILSSPDFC